MIEERTLKVKQPVFHRTGKAWRDFRFTRLEKVNRQAFKALTKLEWLMPGIYLGQDATHDLRKRLSEVLGEKVKVRLEFTRALLPSEVRKYVMEPAFLCVLGTSPDKPRSILDVDLGLSHAMIDLLLGGAGESVAQKPLSNIEEGMMSYVVLELLKGVSSQLAPGIPRLHLEGVCDSLSLAMRHFVEDAQILVIQLQCEVGRNVGGIRFFVPASVLQDVEAPSDAHSLRERKHALFSAHMPRLSMATSKLRVEIGVASLGLADLRGIHPGDVVLLDEWTAKPNTEDHGAARIRLGKGQKGFWEAEIFLEEGTWRAKVNGYKRSQPWKIETVTPQVEAEDEDERQGMDSNYSDEALDAIDDIPLALSVELARIPVTAEDVVALKAGQVLELNRSAGEGVELSVNGKIIGRGELVEVDGQLGVRISQMSES